MIAFPPHPAPWGIVAKQGQDRVVVRHDDRAQAIDAVRERGGGQSREQGSAETDSLILVDDGDRDLGGVRVVGADVVRDRQSDVSVDAAMREAGLTVGGFHAHFTSKEELVRETLLDGLTASMDRLLGPLAGIADDRAGLGGLIRRYLDSAEIPDLAAACPLTLMLSEVARGGPLLQTAFAERSGALLDRVDARFPATAGLSPREVAIAVFARCAGAVAFARTFPAPHARRRIVRAVEAMLHAWLGLRAAPPAASR